MYFTKFKKNFLKLKQITINIQLFNMLKLFLNIILFKFSKNVSQL
jgi:hypothetical protein